MRLISRVLILIIIVLGVYTFQRSYVMRMGYELESLKKEKKHLEQVHNSLLIERAALTSMERIEKIATSYLEMKNPADNQIVMVMAEDSNKAAAAYSKADTEENVTLSQVKMVKYSGRRN